ncbi:hypothetical protein BGZ50_006663 [Haplosporangium sp. Z 11]|nr:hypothetical protein BGZ50_006663 [Haplosporangium sp. Z 11]
MGSTSTSSGSGNRSSNNSTHTFTTRTTVTRATTTESLGQLSLQRFPTGESEYKNSIIENSKKLLSRSKAGGEQSRKPALDAPIKTSRTTSMVSTSSARSSSGSSSGFKFVKPNLSFKPLLYNLGNDSKNQQRLYQHHNNSSTSSASPNASHHRQQHQQALDPFANSPFPSILLSIQLPQSLLDKYVMDVESFRHGKGIWGIGKYSWTVTVLARTNGKRYVIKRVSKSLLPPSAYYHYPTTAHRLCTCPACKSSRDQLLRTGQLDQEELENIQEVLVIQNNGRRKELPQLPSSASQQNQQQGQQQRRPLSASSVKEKKNALNLYSSHNASMPNHQGQSLTFSPNATPQDTPVNSRPSTPSQSPLRQQSSPPLSEEKIHNRGQSHCHTGSTPFPAAQSLSMSATVQSALSWQHKDVDPPTSRARSKTSAQTPEQLSHSAQTSNIRPNSARLPPSSTSASINRKGRPILRRSASTPNLSQTVTGLDVLEDDPARVEQLKQLSRSNRNDWLPHGIKNPWQAKDLHSATFTPLQSTADVMTTKEDGGEAIDQKTMNESLSSHNEHVQMVIERKVSPFDTNEGEFKQLEPAPLRSPTVPLTFVPPPHALPMELVLLQTYNDSDHLPEHHEWTQDQEYWYYVTKAHGVKRRKLKKVSSWWLDMGSLGGALLSGSSSSNEPIATGPIYNMGRVPGTTSPLLSSPLSSEATLPMTDSSTTANGGSRHIAKESISSITSQESSGTTTVSFNTLKRQSSPRNSHMGKYYYVNWDEYTSL